MATRGGPAVCGGSGRAAGGGDRGEAGLVLLSRAHVTSSPGHKHTATLLVVPAVAK